MKTYFQTGVMVAFYWLLLSMPGEVSLASGRGLGPSCGSTAEPPLLAPRPCLPPAPPLPPAAPATVPGPVLGSPHPGDPPPPVVVIRVRVPAVANPGQELEYHIHVENCSAAAAHHVRVKNPLPFNARFVRANPEPNQKKPELEWRLGTLEGGAKRKIVLVLAPAGGGEITNCARVQFEHGECVTTRIAGFGPGETIVPPPGKRKGKLCLGIAGPKKQYFNLPAQYFITATNPGTEPITNVMITNELPANTKFVKAGQDGKFLENQVAWLLGTLEAGGSKTVELVLKAEKEGEICTRAKVVADYGLSATAEWCTVFKGVSALHMDTSDRKDPVAVGEDTSYPIMVTNLGSATVTNIRIRAFLPEALILTGTKPVEHKRGQKTADGYQTLIFEPLAKLAVGGTAEFEVFVKGGKAGDTRLKVELMADQLEEGGPVRRDESTTIFTDNGNGQRPGASFRIPTRNRSRFRGGPL